MQAGKTKTDNFQYIRKFDPFCVRRRGGGGQCNSVTHNCSDEPGDLRTKAFQYVIITVYNKSSIDVDQESLVSNNF